MNKQNKTNISTASSRLHLPQVHGPEPIIRCVIYTRKSTHEGIEKDFTSLDSQRESAENYIASQKNQGWINLPDHYDDYGFTGANMERPALERLLKDIEDGKIDCVVVYKVDRLSRSLLDFSNLLNMFEQHNVTFVSITQHFNTNSSMGRLTLNILLSFAQFEREIIGERTRDKMAGARKRGKFTGGRPALGYDYDFKSKKLLIHKKEAALITKVFKLYVKERSLLATANKLKEQGYITKTYVRKGKISGGVPFNKLNLSYMLRNVLYIGKVRYKDEVFEGEQEAIISEELFNIAQEALTKNWKERRKKWAKTGGGLLSKIFRCEACDAAMVYNYSYKKNYKYQYYMCHRVAKSGFDSYPTKTIAAQSCENTIMDCLQKICDDPRLKTTAWSAFTNEQQRDIIRSIVQVIYYDAIDPTIKIRLIGDPQLYKFEINLKQGRVYRPREEESSSKQPHIRLLLLLAHQIQIMLKEDKTKDLKTIADWLNMDYARICQIMTLLLLSPSIQEEIICSDDERLCKLPEYKMRGVLRELCWEKQNNKWKILLNSAIIKMITKPSKESLKNNMCNSIN